MLETQSLLPPLNTHQGQQTLNYSFRALGHVIE